MNRRDFLKASALASGTVLMPGFLQRLLARGFRPSTEKVLVIVQLSGGNDGLNSLVPYRNDLYYKARPSLAIPKEEVLKVDDDMGLHPQLSPLRPLYDNGQLSFVQNVGYPNPDRSHFRSMDIWHTATDADVYGTTGWLGRYLDHSCTEPNCTHLALEIEDSLSLALRGEKTSGFAVSDPKRLRNTTQTGIQGAVTELQGDNPTGHAELDFLYKTTRTAFQNVEALFRAVQGTTLGGAYPDGQLGKQLALVAALIAAGLETRVYYVSLTGFDTHVRQQPQQQKLMEQLGGCLAAFQQELQQSGQADRVVTMVFSEFGRRVAQNASGGTDHGAGNALWLMGKNLQQPGFLGQTPDLSKLDRGDIQWEVDFRQVYATLLHDWLGADDSAILGRNFDRLKLV